MRIGESARTSGTVDGSEPSAPSARSSADLAAQDRLEAAYAAIPVRDLEVVGASRGARTPRAKIGARQATHLADRRAGAIAEGVHLRAGTPQPRQLEVHGAHTPTASTLSRLPRGENLGLAFPKLSATFADRLAEMAERLGRRGSQIVAVMHYESRGMNPDAINGSSSAVGLIQFMPQTAGDLLGLARPKEPTKPAANASPEAKAAYNEAKLAYATAMRERAELAVQRIASMTDLDQLPLVETFLRSTAGGRPVETMTDAYMNVFMPAFIGKGDDCTLARAAGESALERRTYAQNAGLDANGDHVISSGEAASVVASGVEKSGALRQLMSDVDERQARLHAVSKERAQ